MFRETIYDHSLCLLCERVYTEYKIVFSVRDSSVTVLLGYHY